MTKKPKSSARRRPTTTAGKRASPALAEQLVPNPPSAKSKAEPFPLTMEQEMALAVVLWRAVRFAYRREREIVQRTELIGSSRSSILPKDEDKVNDTAIEMAGRMGVKKEFFEWLLQFPVFKLYLLGLEPWPERIAGIIPLDRKLVTVQPEVPKKGKK